MVYRSRAPLRIGLAGGGTDVSPYSDRFGGAILNATVSLYAHATIELTDGSEIILTSDDLKETVAYSTTPLPTDSKLGLIAGVYNRVLADYGAAASLQGKGMRITTSVDAPAGSGLGTSSTLVVAVVGAFAEMLKLPLGEYDIAQYAYDIERNDLGLAGGRQDQYAATFGGVNFMEFHGDRVIVNPLRIRQEYLNELEHNLVLYFTNTSRESAAIIKQQQQNVHAENRESIEAMHQLKDQARMMKEALLRGRLNEIGRILDFGFQQKRNMAQGISNDRIEEIYKAAISAGATGGKISGAGGGGFMTFYCPGTSRYAVTRILEKFGGYHKPYQFTQHGLHSWTGAKSD